MSVSTADRTLRKVRDLARESIREGRNVEKLPAKDWPANVDGETTVSKERRSVCAPGTVWRFWTTRGLWGGSLVKTPTTDRKL
eukprot:9263690-Pyramimonas_sp.AAC.1